MVIPVRDSVWSDDEDEDEYEDVSSEGEDALLHDEDQNEIEEVQSEDFPRYFDERDGMLFHSLESSPYPLPVDGHEQRRQNMMHKMLYRFLHVHYAGPVPEVLARSTGEPRRKALDLGTGTGKWVMDMGRMFHDSSFIGVDIVPIATQYPLRNTRFEIQDISEQLRWPDGTFDLIHARDLSMGIREWPRLIREITRLLRPGGLFLSCEWALFPSVAPDLQVSIHTHAPASVTFFSAVNEALYHRQVQPVGPDVPQYLAESQQFSEITSEYHTIPIGDWPQDETLSQVGDYFRRICIRFTRSVTPLLRESGLPEFDIGQLVADYTQELQNLEGLTFTYYITYARRL